MIRWTRWLPTAVIAFLPLCSSAGIADRVQRSTVAGVDVVAYATPIQDVVTIVGALPAGDVFAKDGNLAAATITGMLLDRGTQLQDKQQIAERLESVGASIAFGVSEQAVNISATCLEKDLPLVIALLAEQLRQPAFDVREFNKAREQFIGTTQSMRDSVEFRAGDEFQRAVYADHHPNRDAPLDAIIRAAEQLSLDEVKAFHRRYYGPKHLTLVLVGDVNLPLIKKEIARGFAGWHGGVDYIRSAPDSQSATEPGSTRAFQLEQKPSVSVLLGQATDLRAGDDDRLALAVGTAILGSGFTGRLMATVRDKEGLTYGVRAGLRGDTYVPGAWAISATFAPALLDRGVSSLRRELQQWWQDGITEAELAARKTNLIGSFHTGLSTTANIASALMDTIQRGEDLAWLDNYSTRVDALTVAEVNEAIRHHLDPATMVLVTAGSLPSAKL